MALVKCNECGGSVSDAAAVCPHCGVAAPSLTPGQKNQLTIEIKRATYGRVGGALFFCGVGWLAVVVMSGGGGDAFLSAWGVAKWLIGVGAGMYVIAEIERNLAVRKRG